MRAGLRLLVFVLALSTTTLAALVPGASVAERARSPGVPPIIHTSGDPIGSPPELNDPSQQVTAMIRLSEPAAARLGDAAAVTSQRSRNEAQQQRLLPLLAGLDARVLYRTRLAYNGLAVVVPANRVEALRGLPGVVEVQVVVPKARPASQVSAPPAGAGAPWRSLRGATGRGARIGLIDSGIDYTHAAFGGRGTPEAYASNDPVLIEPGSFPTSKVVGGYDFAGDNYDADGIVGSPVPTPDPDPLDCNGHGTHVAGVAAGYGVTANGTTFRGPYDDQVDFSGFLAQPGVAPEASLYAFKIFGCQGSTALLALAIERALDPNGDGDLSDRLDVLLISLGSPFGGPNDPDAVAVDAAVQAGMVVVVAAGDNGNTFYILDSPASASRAIAVGALSTSGDPDAPATPAEWTSRGPQRGNAVVKPDLVAPGSGIEAAAVGSGTQVVALDGTSMAAAQVAGAAALLHQVYPRWLPLQVKAALINTAAPVPLPDGALAPPSLVGAGELDIGALGALDLLAYVADSDAVALSFGAPLAERPWSATRDLHLLNLGDQERVITLASTVIASEPGVSLDLPAGDVTLPAGEEVILPVALAVDPAALEFTADAATPLRQDARARHYLAEHAGFVTVHSQAGTRLRVAHAADAGPLFFEIDEEVLRPALVSGRVGKYRDVAPGSYRVIVRRPGDPFASSPLAETTIDLLDARDYTLILVGKEGALDFLLVDETPPAPAPARRALVHVVHADLVDLPGNLGPVDVYLDGKLQFSGLYPGQVSEFIDVPLGKHSMAFFRAGTAPSKQNQVGFEGFIAREGEVVLVGIGRAHTPAGGWFDPACVKKRTFSARTAPRTTQASQELRVPFQVFPKAASASSVVDDVLVVRASAASFSVDLRNTGARNDADLSQGLAGPLVPLASAFELAGTSPQLTGDDSSLRAADLRYVGVTSNYPVVAGVESTAIFFGVASYGPWSTPSEVQFLIYIDSNLDGVDDYLLLNTNWGAVNSGQPSDVFFSPLYRIAADGSLEATTYSFWGTFQPPSVPPGFDMAPFNTSVIMQAASAGSLGLTSGQTRFRYHVETRARDADRFGRVVDRFPATGKLEYNVSTPAITPINTITPLLALRPVFLDTDGAQITGFVNQGSLTTRGSQGLLILHHHNQPQAQAEVVELQTSTFAARLRALDGSDGYSVALPGIRTGP